MLLSFDDDDDDLLMSLRVSLMEIGFENSALETRQRRTERTQYKMQIPENYGYVVLAIAAMGIPNVVAVVRVIKARSKYGVKYPNLYAPEVL